MKKKYSQSQIKFANDVRNKFLKIIDEYQEEEHLNHMNQAGLTKEDLKRFYLEREDLEYFMDYNTRNMSKDSIVCLPIILMQ